MARKDILKEHVDRVHKGIRYKCNVCDMDFAQKKTLVGHQRRKHAIIV